MGCWYLCGIPRLTKEHERVRQETAQVIIEEQKLSQEVDGLEKEAEKLREVRRQSDSADWARV